MGVNTFLLDRRTASLCVGGTKQVVGTLRRFFKLTEMDAERSAELEAAGKSILSPVAAIIMDVWDLPLAAAPEKPVAAHLVLGWDEGRGSVTDYGWDFLPTLGYAVRDPATGAYTLHEQRDGLLHPVDDERARELGLFDGHGRLVRHGQPTIAACENVRPFLDKYADADCTLSSGRKEILMTVIESGALPPAEWFIGKRPMDVARFEGKS
jgi:hypothetical protein